MKTGISTSRVFGEQAFGLVSNDSKHGSTVVFEDNLKCHEADVQLSDGIASMRAVSTKSEISSEDGSFEMDARKRRGKDLNAAEDGLRTESSCSNTLSSVVLPASFSNQNYQETSKDGYSFKNRGSSMDSSTSKAFDCSLDEPVTASSESGVCVQIARKAIRNARASNRMKMSSMVGNRSSSLTKKGDKEFSHDWDHAGEVLGSKVMEKIEGDFWANESSESLMSKPCKVATENQDTFIAGFDLNEDINANDMDDHIQPVVATISYRSVIHVVAKAGIPNGRPIIPLKFEGALGWKGSAETSAFRPACLSTRREDRFTGIDLNVAALEDPHSQVDSKSPWIDLNCLYDAANDFTQPSLQLESENPRLVDLNLNIDTSTVDKSDKVHWLGQHCQKQDFGFTSHGCLADLSTMQHVVHNAHTLVDAPTILRPVELMQRSAAPQPKLPLGLYTLPPQSYHSNSPFYFSGNMPYTGYPYEQGILPRILNSSTSFYTPRHMQVVHEQITNKAEENLSSTNGSKMDEARQFLFRTKNSPPMGEQTHQEAWYATTTKRKETEGGLECYQLGYKQVT